MTNSRPAILRFTWPAAAVLGVALIAGGCGRNTQSAASQGLTKNEIVAGYAEKFIDGIEQDGVMVQAGAWDEETGELLQVRFESETCLLRAARASFQIDSLEDTVVLVMTDVVLTRIGEENSLLSHHQTLTTPPVALGIDLQSDLLDLAVGGGDSTAPPN